MIKKNISRVVAFDLDGTLIDSAPDITEALNHVLNQNGLKKVEERNVKKLIGSGARALISDAFKKQGYTCKNINELTSIFLKKYKTCFKDKTNLFPYAKEVLKTLNNNGFDLILVSNKPQFYCYELLKYFEIRDFFVAVSGGDTFNYKKPDARHLELTLKKANIDRYKCIFVGDSKIDLQCAKNAKVSCILLTHGYSDIDIKKLSAYKIINHLNNIVEVIENYFQKEL